MIDKIAINGKMKNKKNPKIPNSKPLPDEGGGNLISSIISNTGTTSWKNNNEIKNQNRGELVLR